MPFLKVIYASTSGHTEYVVDTLISHLRSKGVEIDKQIAEKTKAEDLLEGEVLLLASSTWNTGNVEGQLNPHMYMLLLDRAKAVDLKGKKVALIALGDERYFYTANAAKHLVDYVTSHGGNLLMEPLKIVNEPYGQEQKVKDYAETLLQHLS